MSENKQEPVRKEETLDPENWDEMKKLGRQMVEDMLTYQETIRAKTQFKYITDEILSKLKTKVPHEGLGAEKTYDDFQKIILENNTPHFGSPRCWYTVLGQGTPFGALSDMWMSGLNNIAAENNRFNLGPEIELQVLSWLKEMLGYPADSSGILVSGCSHANLTGLIVARNVKAGGNIKENGISSKLTFYGSQEMHTSIQRAIEVMGIGSKNLRKIRVDDDFKINIDELEEKVKEDRKAGYTPCGVIGCAGATNVASFDDLDAIADFCQEQDLWFHIDGAFGAWVALSPKYKHLVKGMERADSLAFDLHKWMYMPYGVGCILVKDKAAHYQAFSMHGDYISHDPSMMDLGMELSRPLRALKVWMSIKEHGVDKYRRMIEKDIELAHYYAELVVEQPGLELIAPVILNVVVFRCKKPEWSEEETIAQNAKLMPIVYSHPELFECGGLLTKVRGVEGFRVCFTNHRSTKKDVEYAFESYLNMCKLAGVS